MRAGIVVVALVIACGKSKEAKELEAVTQATLVVPKVEVATVLAKDPKKVPLILVVEDRDARIAAAESWEALDKGELKLTKQPAPIEALRPYMREDFFLGKPPIDTVAAWNEMADGPAVEIDLRTLEDTTRRSGAASQDDPPPPEEEDKPDDGADESGGTGTAMALEEGKMGKKDSDRAEGAYRMKKQQEDPQLARQQAIERARAAGVIGHGAFASLKGTGDRGQGFGPGGDDGPSRLNDVGGVVVEDGVLEPLSSMIMIAPTAKATRLVDALIQNPGALAVSFNGKIRPLRIQFELRDTSAVAVPEGWLEVRVGAKDLSVEAVPDKAIAITELKQLKGALDQARTARAYDAEVPVDVLVDPAIDAQRLIDVLVALDVAGVRAIGLGAMPKPEELALRGRRLPKLVIGRPSASGELDKREITRVVKGSAGKIRACYEGALKSDPNAAGTVMVAFTISPKGTVSTATTSGVEAVSDCVTAVVKALAFPKPKSGEVMVSYPFTFKP